MIQFGANFSTNGVPTTGLSPTITIYDTSDSSVVVNGVAMSEIAGGAYKYDFTNDTAKKYSIVIDGGVDTLDSRYMVAWSERAKTEAEIVNVLEDTNELQINQGNWLTATGFNTVVPDAAGTAPTAIENRQEMDSNSTRLDANISTRSSHDAAAVKTAMEAVGTKLTLVKTATDKMNFTGDDIKATLDAEKVNLTDATEEQIDDLHQLQGLDISKPMTVTPTSRKVGTIEQNISGDGVAMTTIQRTA